jgi:hypothetical protein
MMDLIETLDRLIWAVNTLSVTWALGVLALAFLFARKKAEVSPGEHGRAPAGGGGGRPMPLQKD